jgi:PAS domain S-box-containing protein
MKTLTRNLSLSNREEQILLLASRGLTDRQISAELGIRAGTINTHWSRIRLKLGAATRSEAVSILLKEKASLTQQALEAEKQTLLDDLVQRKQVEHELRDGKRLLQSVLANAPIILWSTDDQGSFVTIEGKLLGAIGLKPASGIKQRAAVLSRMIPPEAIEKAFGGEEVTEVTEFEGLWFETLMSPLLGPRGVVTGLIGVSMDVTERKRAEIALLENQQFLNGILEMSPTVTWVFDVAKKRHTYMSPSVVNVLGYTPAQVRAMGEQQFREIVHPDDVDGLAAFVGSMKEAEDGEVRESVYRLKHASGEWRWFVERTCVFRRSPKGAVECLLSVSQDINDFKNSHGR